MIKYSIILTTLNEEKNIVEVMNQFAKFKRNDFEVIVIDGESRDRTIDLIKKQNYQFPLTIKIDDSDLNTARNLGIDFAKGDVVCIATADNILPENYLDRLDKHYDEGHNVVLCLYALPANTEIWSGAWSYAQHRFRYDGKEHTDDFLWTEGFSCHTDLARRIRFPYINKNSSGEEGWFGRRLKESGAKFAYVTDIDVKHIVPETLFDFYQDRKNRTRGTVFIEYYLDKIPFKSIMGRAYLRAIANFFMFLLQIPSLFEAFRLYPKVKEKKLKHMWWFFKAGQIDLFARMIGKFEAVNVIKKEERDKIAKRN